MCIRDRLKMLMYYVVKANCDNGGTTDHTKNISYTVDICMPGQTNFTGYQNHFRMPSSESGGTGNFWYR